MIDPFILRGREQLSQHLDHSRKICLNKSRNTNATSGEDWPRFIVWAVVVVAAYQQSLSHSCSTMKNGQHRRHNGLACNVKWKFWVFRHGTERTYVHSATTARSNDVRDRKVLTFTAKCIESCSSVFWPFRCTHAHKTSITQAIANSSIEYELRRYSVPTGFWTLFETVSTHIWFWQTPISASRGVSEFSSKQLSILRSHSAVNLRRWLSV